jgi:hypothetical protein
MVERTSCSNLILSFVSPFDLFLSLSFPLTFGPTFLQRWADLGGSDATDFSIERVSPLCPSLLTLVHILLWALLIISVFAAVAGAVFVSSVDIIKCPTNVSILSLHLSLDQLDHLVCCANQLSFARYGRVGHENGSLEMLWCHGLPRAFHSLTRSALGAPFSGFDIYKLLYVFVESRVTRQPTCTYPTTLALALPYRLASPRLGVGGVWWTSLQLR